MSNQPMPSPLEVKKPNSWKIVTIVLLVIVVVMGAIIGILWMRQVKQSEYTTVKVFSDSSPNVKLGNYTYIFLYKWSYGYDPQNPIEIRVQGLSKTLPAMVGTYNVLSIEVVISEVNDDYVILFVREP